MTKFNYTGDIAAV